MVDWPGQVVGPLRSGVRPRDTAVRKNMPSLEQSVAERPLYPEIRWKVVLRRAGSMHSYSFPARPRFQPGERENATPIPGFVAGNSDMHGRPLAVLRSIRRAGISSE